MASISIARQVVDMPTEEVAAAGDRGRFVVGDTRDPVDAVGACRLQDQFASSWTQRVTSVSAGPPLGGLYLKPPSSGGLCDGVTTIPSARRRQLSFGRLATRIACETAGGA